MLLAQQYQPLSRFDGHLLCDVNVEVRTGMRMHRLSSLEYDDLANPALPLQQTGFVALWEMKEFAQP